MKATTSAPTALPNCRRVSFTARPGHVFPIVLRRAQHRADDPAVGAASAQVLRQRLAHLGCRRVRVVIEQILRRHDHAVDAIAALGGLLVDEGLLQRMRLVDGAEPLDRGDLGLADGTDLGDARAHRPAVEQHRAGAALGEPAAEFGAVQREIVAQHVEQRRIGLRRHRSLRAVDLETDRHRFIRLRESSRLPYAAAILPGSRPPSSIRR